jgi:hypothetical protein
MFYSKLAVNEVVMNEEDEEGLLHQPCATRTSLAKARQMSAISLTMSEWKHPSHFNLSHIHSHRTHTQSHMHTCPQESLHVSCLCFFKHVRTEVLSCFCFCKHCEEKNASHGFFANGSSLLSRTEGYPGAARPWNLRAQVYVLTHTHIMHYSTRLWLAHPL